ncbi:MAG: TetR/AcrR family transcriptional regulator [Acidobacteriota bacterium]|nr:TetR/AcrR family transcriptional regulator [Acidobacteriota bacterium]
MSSPRADATSAISGYPHGRVPRAVRSEQLREVALELFAERGFHATSIEDIRRRAGVSRPTFYSHFASKEAVYIACLQRARERLNRSISTHVDQQDEPREQLRHGVDGYFEFAELEPLCWRLIFGGGDAVTGPAGEQERQLRLVTIELLAELIQRAVPAADDAVVEAYANGLSGSGEQLARWWVRHPDVPRERMAGYLMEITWGGLQALVRVSGGASGASSGETPRGATGRPG